MIQDASEAAVFERAERAILQVGWLGQRQFMQLLSEQRFDLTVPQFYTLLHISIHEGECKMSDLARSTHQSAASLTGVIDRLLDKHLVERARPEGDRRQVTVKTTERGQVLLHEIKLARTERMRSAFGQISAEEADLLMRLLDTISSALAAQMGSRHEEHSAR